jgi:enamine deaminase RidA (YjgF/YER057c/UK114 family)
MMTQPHNQPPLSRYRIYQDLIFVSGQVPVVGSERHVPESFDEQVEAVLENLKAAVTAAGSNLGAILKVNAFLADRRDIPAFNQAYKASFEGHDLPARTMLIAQLPDSRYLLEIECVAYKVSA